MGFLKRCLKVVANPTISGRMTAIALSLPGPIRSSKSRHAGLHTASALAGTSHDAGREAGGDGRPGHHAGALPAVPPHSDLRAARLARSPDVRAGAGPAARPGGGRSTAPELQGGGSDARGRVSRRPR